MGVERLLKTYLPIFLTCNQYNMITIIIKFLA